MPFWIHFVSIFDIAFGMRFGKHFDRIPDRNWIQKGSQSGSRIHKKIDFSARVPFQAFMDHFGIILVPFWFHFDNFWVQLFPFGSRFGSFWFHFDHICYYFNLVYIFSVCCNLGHLFVTSLLWSKCSPLVSVSDRFGSILVICAVTPILYIFFSETF